MTDLVIKNPDGSYATTDATNLKGHNWHKTIRASDGTIPEEDIKRYHDIAMKLQQGTTNNKFSCLCKSEASTAKLICSFLATRLGGDRASFKNGVSNWNK